tara:strand:+ start:87 stop:392 length:306 start_codon:yes stop_codon:yes gene_type:complete
MTVSGSLNDIFGITRRRELTEEELKPLSVGTLVKLKPGAVNQWAFGGEMRSNETRIRGLILKKTSSKHIYLVAWNDGTTPVLEYREDLEVIKGPKETNRAI